MNQTMILLNHEWRTSNLRNNERLKEALIKFRDLPQETEQEQRRRVSEMEKDVAGIDEPQ